MSVTDSVLYFICCLQYVFLIFYDDAKIVGTNTKRLRRVL